MNEELIPSEVSELISKKPELTYILLKSLLFAYFQSIDNEPTQDKIDNLIYNFLNSYETTEKKIKMEDIN